MATQYQKNGTSFIPASSEALNIHPTLPAGNYIVCFNPQIGFYFDKVAGFEMPTKLYGDTVQTAERIMTTFLSRTGSTGVLANGEKGSGKTLLAKLISNMGIEMDMPTIIINRDWHGDGFNKLMQDITQPCIIIFDEFEKVYGREQQQHILTLLDGVFPTRKLFMFTCNDKFMIDMHMCNRPGRIFYLLDYKGLKADFITEYCQDKLDDKQHTEAIVNIASTFEQFNFDILQALVEEMNRYKEDPFEALKMLNATPSREKGGKFGIELFINGEKCEMAGHNYYSYTQLQGTPISHKELTICSRKKNKWGDGEDEWDWEDEPYMFTQNMLVGVDANIGQFTYSNGAGAVVKFTRQIEEEFNLSQMRNYFAL